LVVFCGEARTAGARMHCIDHTPGGWRVRGPRSWESANFRDLRADFRDFRDFPKGKVPPRLPSRPTSGLGLGLVARS
jgi:hypothetical protein